MNKVFKSLTSLEGAPASPKTEKKKYIVLGCEESGEVKETFSTDSQTEAEEWTKKYPVANIMRRGKTISVFEYGRRIRQERKTQL